MEIGHNANSLAYIGDAVFELMVRRRLIQLGVGDTGKLTTMAHSFVCAGFQSAAVESLLPVLTDQETEIYKRGRNANSTARPKRATVAEYRRATGLEALFGHLYLTDQISRLEQLFDLVYQGEMQEKTI